MSAARLSPLFTWRSAICDSGLPPTTRHVALTLSLHMSERGDSAFPGNTLLAEETGYSRATVITHLKLLREKGWLVLAAAGGGKGKANRWQARVPEAVENAPQTVQQIDPLENRQPGKRSISRAQTVNLVDSNGPAAGPQDVKNVSRTEEQELASAAPTDLGKTVPDSTPEKQPSLRDRRTAIKDAIVEACGWDPEHISKRAWGRVEEAAKDLDQLGYPLPQLLEDIAAFAIFWEQTYEIAALTPQALTANWPDYKAGKLFRSRGRRGA